MLVWTAAAWLITAVAAKPLTVDDCVRIALQDSARVAESAAKIEEFRARLAEVESLFYPKLFGLGIVAPMFTVEYDPTTRAVERRYDQLKHWGPFARLEAVLAQPLLGFGRMAAARSAARHRMQVEEARLRETRNIIALEVRKLYAVHLYARSLQPSLDKAAELVDEAIAKAEASYAEATGEVTQVDLSKLQYAKAEVSKYRLRARGGASVALLALKHSMGMPADVDLQLAEERLATDLQDYGAELELAPLLQQAAALRPEWAQLEHGEQATLSWEQAEALAGLPVLFLAGQFRAAWTPTRTDSTHPYDYDPYNEVFGGVALGLKFDIDPWLADAKADVARATYDQVHALRRFAETGIPLQVHKAFTDVQQTRVLAQLSQEGGAAAKKWMAFAATAFLTGTGEAKDVLEGLVAYLQSKNAEYEGLRDLRIAHAELEFAVGRAFDTPQQ